MKKISLGFFMAIATIISVSAQEKEPDEVKWDKTASFGLTLTRGNSETMLATANIQADRTGSENEISLGGTATYGEDQGQVNTKYLRGFGQYNRLFNDKLFGYLRVDALHDEIADLNIRLSIGPGVGYYFLKNDRATLTVEAGGSYVYEEQGGIDDSYATVRFAERYTRKINENTKFWQNVEIQPQVDDWENFLLMAEIGVESKITDNLSLRVVLQDTYDNVPAAGRESNDIRLISGISYTF
jgi:putative salt-induced outer membrane protein YdiY